MELDFWKQAWEDRNIGFHQSEYNSAMTGYYDKCDLENKSVFIPLAGKSKDILYFLAKGAQVTAVELSELACEEFFNENHVLKESVVKTSLKEFTVYKSKNLTYYCGDFFKLSKEDLPKVDFYFDRACIVALPKHMRASYFKKLETLLDKLSDIFILTFLHEGPLDIGPPFKVPKEEILSAYSKMGIELVYTEYDRVKASKRYQDAGIKKFTRLQWNKAIK